MVDMTGKKIGRLTVIKRVDNKRKYAAFECKCDCGNTICVEGYRLRNGNVRSCGCLRKETMAHAHVTHHCSKERLYHVWALMKSRCLNPNDHAYKNYGGRGITVCGQWMKYEAFREWAYSHGYDDKAPKGECTIDRIDNNSGYSPDNCRFVSIKEQHKNKRQGNQYTTGRKKGDAI